MTNRRLLIFTVAALAFALFETWVAYDEPTDRSNIIWAGFAWVCLLFVVGLWWETGQGK